MADPLRYQPAALMSAVALVARTASAETARVVESLIRARGEAPNRSIDLENLAIDADAGNAETVRRRLDAASLDFRATFGAPLIGSIRFAEDYADRQERSDEARIEVGETPRQFWLASAFADVLDRPFPLIDDGDAPLPDPATASWIAIAAACVASDRGHHLAMRCLDRGPPELIDVARLIASRVAEVRLGDRGDDSVELAVLRAELHGGPDPAMIVMDREVATTPKPDDDDGWDVPLATAVLENRHSSDEDRRLRLLREVRNTYVWRAPGDLVVDPRLATFYGGVIGPFVPERQWSDAVIARMAPGIGAAGIQAIASRVADPRDAGALAAMAGVAATALGVGLNEAAVFVAASLSGARPATPAVPADFDARLVVCDEEGQLLLARAQELARLGGRVLFHGPPGGGKSTFAQALAAAMGRGARTVTGASVLARHWGVTERIIADTWSRAAEGGSTLIIDEIDSLCGVREPGASSGNAYLIRTLTNEFLRAFDSYSSVPVIATANHLEAIDEAVRRRFTFVINVRGDLTPEAEELAWRSILGLEPPCGWAPVGANVSDFANAAKRCRMLGLMDASQLASAIERSRDARLGPVVRSARGTGPLQ